MVIEIIFKGSLLTLDFKFLRNFLLESKEVRFNFPEIYSIKTFEEVINIIHSDTYIDLVINTDYLDIKGKIVPRVFINLERNNDEIEMLLFFELNDLNVGDMKMNIDFLREWVIATQIKYCFQYYICQMDNADKSEYYFDSNGLGKLYHKLIDKV